MNWKIFFKNLKEKNKNFKSPIFLVKPKNRAKLLYTYNKPFVFTKKENYIYVTDGIFNRYISPDSFISFNFKNSNKNLFFNIEIKTSVKTEKLIGNGLDNFLFFYKDNEIVVFKNYNILFTIDINSFEKITLTASNELLEIDYIKDYLESVEINIFSFTESLLKKINDKLNDFYTFNDFNFINYILNHKKTTIENYFNFNKSEILNSFLNFKGSYNDLELIKKANIFEKIIFKDENSKYTNFINYFFNIIPDNMNFIIETFIKNYNLYQKFKNNFKCIILPKESYYEIDWNKILMGNCSYINIDNNYIKGLYFVNDVIGNKIKFSINNIYLDNLQNRYIEVVNDVKNYINYLETIRTTDFNQNKMIIDNNANIKINNNTNFLIPGQEINFSSIQLDGSNKDCYLDYVIRINLDDNEKIQKLNDNLLILQQILKERMPFLLKSYLEYVEGVCESIYYIYKRISELIEFDIEFDTNDIFDYKKLSENINYDITRNFDEEFNNNFESFKLRLNAKTNEFPKLKIFGTGVIDRNNAKVMGYLTNDNCLDIKGSNLEEVLPYANLKVGRYCFIGNNVADVFVTFDTPISEKYKNNKNLVKCRYDTLYEYYQNNLIKITNNYFKYINGTENISNYSELNNLNLDAGIYTLKNHFYEIENYNNTEWKIIGSGIIYNNKAYIVDLKEQFFKGKPNNKIIARDYIIVNTDNPISEFPEGKCFENGIYYISLKKYQISNYFKENWKIDGCRILENNKTYIINALNNNKYTSNINAKEYVFKIK